MKVFVLLFICLFLVAPKDQNVRGRVSSVTDGDTLKVTLGSTLVRVRLAEIDSPEIRQPGGVESKKALSRKVLGRQVRVRSEGYDRYGRLLAHMKVNDTLTTTWLKKGTPGPTVDTLRTRNFYLLRNMPETRNWGFGVRGRTGR